MLRQSVFGLRSVPSVWEAHSHVPAASARWVGPWPLTLTLGLFSPLLFRIGVEAGSLLWRLWGEGRRGWRVARVLAFLQDRLGSFHEAAETSQNPGCPPPRPWEGGECQVQAHLSGCWDAAFSIGSFSWPGFPFGRKTGLETPREDSSPQNAPGLVTHHVPSPRLPAPPRPRAPPSPSSRDLASVLWKEALGLVLCALRR